MKNPLPSLDYLTNCMVIAQRHSLVMSDDIYLQMSDVQHQMASNAQSYGNHPLTLPTSKSLFGQIGDQQAQTWYLNNSPYDKVN